MHSRTRAPSLFGVCVALTGEGARLLASAVVRSVTLAPYIFIVIYSPKGLEMHNNDEPALWHPFTLQGDLDIVISNIITVMLTLTPELSKHHGYSYIEYYCVDAHPDPYTERLRHPLRIKRHNVRI